VLCLALTTAILAFRIATFAISVAFLLLRMSPFYVIAVFHRVDNVIAQLFSICAAILASRWQERILEKKNPTTNYAVLVIVTISAFCALLVGIDSRPVMSSPLEIAIEGDYPIETVELLIDRYPELINGRNVEWDHFCPLELAAYRGKTNLVELLARKGANVDHAIRRLMQSNAKEEIALVLKCSKDHNKGAEQ
jgi:hypothetical protein